MSDDKQDNAKRATAPQEPPAPATPIAAEAESAIEALPEPKQLAALPAPTPDMQRGADRCFAAYRATLTSIGESQAAVVSDMTAMALEMSGLAHVNLTVAGDGVTALLTARSLVDAVEAQFGFARRSLDVLADGSTRLGELGRRLADDAAKPMMRAFSAV